MQGTQYATKRSILCRGAFCGPTGPDALAVCRAHRGLPVGFLLLWYSVLFTAESLSLLYLLVIS